MQYALLVYAPSDDADDESRPMPEAVVAALDRPEISGWSRLRGQGSATTVRHQGAEMLLTDGPFIETKEYLAGLFLIEADNLDKALSLAEHLLQSTRDGVAIEVRPIFDGHVRGT